MSLVAGQTLSFYEILGPLGAGGMGEVYRARDTRLEREVAIKVLPEELADDEERLRRFEREARTLASLNHPNIAGIHGIDQLGDTCFIALELVPGEDLKQRLARGALPLDEALDVCRQIAEGLEAAHEAGVVHRDLKPANVRITPEGVAKLLDFGLAKPVGPRAPGSTGAGGRAGGAESDSFLVTEEGAVLGTPTYMSPEQARGRPVDRRTDVWAFGCVLYECLAGRRAFAGGSFSDVMASILGAEPDWTALPAATPPRVRELLAACLVKEARSRLRDAGDARLALERVRAGDVGSAAPLPAAPSPSARLRALALGGWGLALAAAAWSGWLAAGRPGTSAARPPPVTRTSVLVPADHELRNVHLGPDGRRLVYAAVLPGERWPRLFLRHLDAFEPRPLAGGEDVSRARFSPDGLRLAIQVEEGTDTGRSVLAIVHLEDGTVREVQRLSSGHSFVWETDESLLILSPGGRLSRSPVVGGELEHLADLAEPESLVSLCDVLRDGRRVLFTRLRPPASVAVECVDLETGERREVLPETYYARELVPGTLVARAGVRLVATGFDAERMATRGAPLQVLEEDVLDFSVAESGTLAYLPARSAASRPRPTLARVDREGTARILDDNPTGASYDHVRVAPGGATLSVVAGEYVLLVDVASGASTRLVLPGFDEIEDHAWHPDGERIAFTGWSVDPGGGRPRGGVYLARVDGTGEPEVLVETDDVFVHTYFPASWSRDGSVLLVSRYTHTDEERDFDADLLLVAEGGEPRPFVATDSAEDLAAFSPDGRLVAYESAAGSRTEVLVCDLDPASGLPRRTWRASPAGGRLPRWSHDGSELYFLAPDDRLVSVSVQAPSGGGTLMLGAPEPLLDLRALRLRLTDQPYDVTPEGDFVILQEPRDVRDAGEIRVVQGWTEEVLESLRR